MKQQKEYSVQVHAYGRAWMIAALIMMLMVPVSMCIYFGVWPNALDVLAGLLGVAPIYWVVCSIEVFTYAPMLGSGGTYLAFVTGNITNLKAPAAINAMEAAKVKPGSEEGEVISTIAIATTSIVTTLILGAGVLLFAQMQPILKSPVLQPAFKMILPALFGGLGVVYIAKNWKLAIAPLVVMIGLFVAVPSLASSVSVLVPVGALIAIGTARILYKKGLV
ncbi:hypothetical protein [Anaeromassilibacillus sp. An200]|uniref:Uncharacterized protein n=1 Tax=Candidatus Caccousia stercoris TaxID=2840723 RepID=A0A9D1FRP3_9FIRM|nr:hypothetical protein [Anaeromassilibacillus sp. An200]OUP08719.1 hypothetical protein B5F35_13060 [Anaeromassilibacillus sp. An200]HIS78522.1 hypothetical protein [Candidatus Caccousia stercoris]